MVRDNGDHGGGPQRISFVGAEFDGKAPVCSSRSPQQTRRLLITPTLDDIDPLARNAGPAWKREINAKETVRGELDTCKR